MGDVADSGLLLEKFRGAKVLMGVGADNGMRTAPSSKVEEDPMRTI